MPATWTHLDSISMQSVQLPTEQPPTGTVDADGIPNEGMSKEAVIAVTIIADAGPGNIFLSEYGGVLVYEYDQGQWAEAPTLSLEMPRDSAGKQRVSMGTLSVENRRGRMAPICLGIETNGSTVTLDILATIDRRGVAKAV